jgi:hypothetical protein
MRENAAARLILLLTVVAACTSRRPASEVGTDAAPARRGSPFETFDADAPRVGDVAPAFELQDLDGKRVSLASAVARGPVVLVFGSFS